MIHKTKTTLSIVIICCCLMGCFASTNSDNINDIITLLKAKVGEEVIKAHIAHKGMTFDLSAEDIIKLKKAGASDNLLSYMIAGADGGFPFELEEEFLVHKPTVHKHLAVYPVFRKISIDIEDYITLDEAQNANVIVITEQTSASVPTVIIKNTGKKPVYIMAGEIIVGGKQDRMVSFDVIVPAGEKVTVEVRCVEHGRWHGKSAEFKSGGAVGCKDVRSALQFKGQQDVWDEVSKVCKANDVGSASGTYGAVLSSEEVEQKSKDFLDVMSKCLEDKEVVGMIMALNGEVVCVDIFAAPKFFAKVKGKLLKAYVLDAISAEETSNECPGRKEILAFFDELKIAQTEELKRYDGNCNYEKESEKIIGNECQDSKGRTQHLNLYVK